MDGWVGSGLYCADIWLDWIGLVSCRSFLIKSMMDIGGGVKTSIVNGALWAENSGMCVCVCVCVVVGVRVRVRV